MACWTLRVCPALYAVSAVEGLGALGASDWEVNKAFAKATGEVGLVFLAMALDDASSVDDLLYG